MDSFNPSPSLFLCKSKRSRKLDHFSLLRQRWHPQTGKIHLSLSTYSLRSGKEDNCRACCFGGAKGGYSQKIKSMSDFRELRGKIDGGDVRNSSPHSVMPSLSFLLFLLPGSLSSPTNVDMFFLFFVSRNTASFGLSPLILPPNLSLSLTGELLDGQLIGSLILHNSLKP